jgi:hypothetical protein
MLKQTVLSLSDKHWARAQQNEDQHCQLKARGVQGIVVVCVALLNKPLRGARHI